MTRSTRFRFALLAFVPALMCAVSCGKKGPPLAPLLRVPARGDEVRLRRLGNDVTVGFRIPDKNTDGSSPANLEKMELRALTGDVVDEIGRPLDNAAFVKYSALVAQVEVEPPPPPDEEEAEPSDGKEAAPPKPPKPPKPPDPRPAQGETIVIVETLTDAARTPATVKTMRKPPKLPPPIEPTPPIAQPLISPPIARLARTYVVVGVNKKGQAGMPSARLAVPLDDPPPPPGTPTVKYTATAMVVEWAASADALGLPAPAVAVQPPLPAKPLGMARAPHTYNVYEVTTTPPAGAAAALALPAPLNAVPLGTPLYQDGQVAFGVERCFVVRTVEAVGPVTLESAPSPPACVSAAGHVPAGRAAEPGRCRRRGRDQPDLGNEQ